MQKILFWIKNNKFTFFLSCVVLFLLIKGSLVPSPVLEKSSKELGRGGAEFSVSKILDAPAGGGVPYRQATPQLDIEERKVVKSSNLSLLVENVRETIDTIASYADSAGGYMVNSSILSPEEVTTGNISVRIPSEKLDETLAHFRTLSVRTVSENIFGRDVTDEYVDVESRLETLYSTKSKYEGIMAQASDVDDILRVQQAIFQIQSQIESLQGRLKYMDATTKSSLITVYLSTDEMELPYAPKQPWRPKVVLKYASRSLITTFRSLGTGLIWVAVYSVIWVPALIIFIIIKKKKKPKIR